MKALCGKPLSIVTGDGIAQSQGHIGLPAEKTCETCLRIAAGKGMTVDHYARPRDSWSWHVERE